MYVVYSIVIGVFIQWNIKHCSQLHKGVFLRKNSRFCNNGGTRFGFLSATVTDFTLCMLYCSHVTDCSVRVFGARTATAVHVFSLEGKRQIEEKLRLSVALDGTFHSLV